MRIGRPFLLLAIITGVAALVAVDWPALSAAGGSCRVFGRIATQDGEPLAGVALQLSTGQATRATGPDGRFTFYLAAGAGSCAIRPVLAGYDFVPAQRTVQPLGSDVRADFTAVPGGSAHVMAALSGPPDLVISKFNVTPSVSELGTELTATIQGKNRGVRRTRTTFHIAFWQHSPRRPDGTGYDMRWTIAGLAKRAKTPLLTYQFTPTLGRSYKAWAMIDPSRKVREADEDNNLRSCPYIVHHIPGQGRDLIIQSLVVIPNPSQLGTELTATVIGANIGTADVPGTIGISFWRNRTDPPTDRTDEDAYWSVPNLPAGETTAPLTCKFTPTEKGAFTAWALIDSTKVWAETDETNNTKSCEYIVDGGVAKPELQIYGFTIGPDPVHIGQSVNVKVQIINTSATAARAFHVGFWKDRNTPPPNGTGTDYKWAVTGLEGGALTPWLTWSFLSTQGGQFQGWVFADCDSEVDEANEGNNQSSATWRVVGPDLIISYLDVSPQSSSLGTALTATVKVKNVGTWETAGVVVNVGFWKDLSAPPIDCSGANKIWTFEDLAIDEEAGPFTYGFTPAAVGSYKAWAFVDCSNDVPELLEDNNTESFDYQVN